MVVGQIALSLMLLTAGGLFARGALKAASANPGFSYRPAAPGRRPIPASSSTTRRAAAATYRIVLERIAPLPGVEAVGMASSVPFGDIHEGQSVERVDRRARRPTLEATYRIVGSGLLSIAEPADDSRP